MITKGWAGNKDWNDPSHGSVHPDNDADNDDDDGDDNNNDDDVDDDNMMIVMMMLMMLPMIMMATIMMPSMMMIVMMTTLTCLQRWRRQPQIREPQQETELGAKFIFFWQKMF